MGRPILPRANAKSLGKSHLCHCEERSDEAISIPRMEDCFASLAMTYRAVLSNDFAFALPYGPAPPPWGCPSLNLAGHPPRRSAWVESLGTIPHVHLPAFATMPWTRFGLHILVIRPQFFHASIPRIAVGIAKFVQQLKTKNTPRVRFFLFLAQQILAPISDPSRARNFRNIRATLPKGRETLRSEAALVMDDL
jgi:hypothetical protein